MIRQQLHSASQLSRLCLTGAGAVTLSETPWLHYVRKVVQHLSYASTGSPVAGALPIAAEGPVSNYSSTSPALCVHVCCPAVYAFCATRA
jgi:hypothetical protein